jgi:hypothetical protein
MLALKRIVTVVVMVYLLLSLLFILSPAVRSSIMGLGDGLSSLEQERHFFYLMFVIGAVILALHLVTENMDSVLLRRAVSQHESKINELKAKLYDHQQQAIRPASTAPRPEVVEQPVRPERPIAPAADHSTDIPLA